MSKALTNDMTAQESAMLYEWTIVTVDEMVSAGYAKPPVVMGEGLRSYLQALYETGMTPHDAVEAAFATRH